LVRERKQATPSWQQLRCDCRSACGEYRASEDDGDPAIWFEPLDGRKEKYGDEANPKNMHKRLRSGHQRSLSHPLTLY
jgi:hypothetical protein